MTGGDNHSSSDLQVAGGPSVVHRSGELTPDQLLAEPTVQLLMHRDRTDEATPAVSCDKPRPRGGRSARNLGNSLGQQFHRGVDQVVPQISRFRHQAVAYAPLIISAI